jgi:NTE family protein
LIDGRKIVAFIRHYVTFDRIERLPIPFRAVAADVTTGGEVVLSDGDALEAIRASISVPGMFTPVNRRGVLLVDGGIVNPIPVSVARTLGNDPVLAVDVNHFESRAVSHTESTAPRKPAEPRRHALPVEANRIIDQIQSRLRERWPRWDSFRKPTDTRDQPSLFEVLGNSVRIMESQIAATRLAIDKPDWLIRPSLGDIRFMDFHRAEEIIRRGHAAVKIAR